MADWIELVEDYELVESQDGLTGKRAFYNQVGAAGSLPALGSSFVTFDSTTITNLVATTRQRKIFWYERAGTPGWREKIVVSYVPDGGSSAGSKRPDTTERRYQLGGEIISIPDPSSSSWVWDLSGGTVEQPLFFSNVMGSFTRQRYLTSDAQKATAVGLWESQAGTINDAAFEDHRIGSVLFSGVDGGTQIDEDGDKVWLFNLQFTFRIVKGKDYNGATVTQDDWLYLIYQGSDGGVWDKPKLGTDYLYAKTDFTALF